MAVCVESYRAWLSTEARTDDITVIVIDLELGRGLRWGAGFCTLGHPTTFGLLHCTQHSASGTASIHHSVSTSSSTSSTSEGAE